MIDAKAIFESMKPVNGPLTDADRAAIFRHALHLIVENFECGQPQFAEDLAKAVLEVVK